jgi:ABC-type uncharacterized transport system substrate-binding protein
MTRRRLAFLLAAGLLAAPLAAGAQQAGKTAVIGFLVPANPPPGWIEALRVGLRDLGYVEGQNLKIEHRFAEGEAGHFPGLFAELVRLKVDVIVTWTTPAALAAKQATSTIPIVAYTGNPVATGLVATLARPGGNVTGIAILTEEVDRKSLELLKEAVPAASQIAILTNPTNPVWSPTLREVQKTARTLGVRPSVIEVRDGTELDNAFATARREQVAGLLVLRDALFITHRTRIADLAMQHRLPAIAGNPEFVEAGLLMAHGVNFPALGRSRITLYIDKILKGAKPADLPVEQPTRFQVIINMKTAKALGLTIPPSLLLRADQMIE